ncbi:bifunctional 4-hydroxy-2-oxoglutarate aldolase/2-dehydro-3-deoxy-phosphogluconate aldolase [Hyphococcus sp. DH-69]|uniref:bifunctional 4-hydroxy-2-oxoglutarate aldolase/2-dehydro-3-deoxy-phosphogluconate aldolase n=1 Tax=Hyphococcus formosus TaxID=3143534 RepID=UPI00398ABB37
MDSMKQILAEAVVMPVFQISDLNHAAPLAHALKAGGLSVIELTMRTPEAVAALPLMKKAVPSLTIGMGTVTSFDDLNRALTAKPDFLVTPGCSPSLIEHLLKQALPFLPGVATPSGAMIAREKGVEAMKFFPAEASGGVDFLKSLYGPLPDIVFCPTGGITLETAKNYLALPNVPCIGGSWIAPAHLIQHEDWDSITENASLAAGLAKARNEAAA